MVWALGFNVLVLPIFKLFPKNHEHINLEERKQRAKKTQIAVDGFPSGVEKAVIAFPISTRPAAHLHQNTVRLQNSGLGSKFKLQSAFQHPIRCPYYQSFT